MPANQSTLLSNDISSLEFLGKPETMVMLTTAAGMFVKRTGAGPELWAASRDWFLEEWGRDTFISLPGILLTTGRFDEARQIFLHFAAYEQSGLIPNVIRQDKVRYNTADASLWLIHALESYVDATSDWEFVRTLLPVAERIVRGYMSGTEYERNGTKWKIGMDNRDGLIVSPPQATWMDADPTDDGMSIVTPRNGKCVEINALWYAALRFLIASERKLHTGLEVSSLEQVAQLVQNTFSAKFWNAEESCLYDVIEGDPAGASIRPNQLFAISLTGDLLDPDKQKSVLAVVKRDLLTPGGLRTLSPDDASYRGEYDTTAPMTVKDLAYHQGTAWPWLIGPYADALRNVERLRDTPERQIDLEIGAVVAHLVQFCLESEFHSLPEVFSGNPPYQPGGTTSQAWSVAETLRVLKSVAPTFAQH